MSKIIVDSIEPNDGKSFKIFGDVNIEGNLTASNVASAPRKRLGVHPSWGNNSNEFEFIFETFNWATIGDPTAVRKPFSLAINPKTGNNYRTDFLKNIDNIVTNTRLVWMDGHPSKYYDWNYHYWDLRLPNSFSASTTIFGLVIISEKGNNTPVTIQFINNPSPGGLPNNLPPPQQPNTFVATMNVPNNIVVYYDDTNGILSTNDLIDALNLANLNVAYDFIYIGGTNNPIVGGVQNIGPITWNYSINPGPRPYAGGTFLSNTLGISPWNNFTNYIVRNRVTYNGFIWECRINNQNQVPTYSNPLTDPWHNTGIPVNTGFNNLIPTYFTANFSFNQFETQAGQNLFTAGNGGWIDGVQENWDLSKGISNNYQGKKPVITLNVFMNPTNSNRYDFNPNQKFTPAYQVEMLSAIQKEVLSPEIIQLGSQSYVVGNCIPGPIPPNPFLNNGIPDGFIYGKNMIDYAREIRTNASSAIRNSKLVIQSQSRVLSTTTPGAADWSHNYFNPFDQTKGFIHGFYDSQNNNPIIYDFDIISFQTGVQNEILSNYRDSINNVSPWSWACNMGPYQYNIMRNTIADCKQALSLYGSPLPNKIKYWYRYVSSARPSLQFPVPITFTIPRANHCWATQTGVFLSLILSATDPDFRGFQFNSLIDYQNCNLGCLYNDVNTFGPNTTDVMDYTPTGWMFNNFINYFKKENGAISYQRISPQFGLGWNSALYGFSNHTDDVYGVYIISTGVNNKKHRIILCNCNQLETSSAILDLTDLITPQMTNIQFQKIYTPNSIYEPINWYRPGGTYETAIFGPVYNPNPGNINATLLSPKEYLMITAD